MKFLYQFIVGIYIFITLCINGKTEILKVPDCFETIQAAIDSASAGDTVLVSEGIYCERLVLKAGIELLGSDPELTKIRGDGRGDVIVGADNCLISGFTVEESGSQFFAIRCDSTSPTIQKNIIVRNGGGIYLINSNAIIEQNLIVENDDGSDYGTMAIFCRNEKPIIRNNTIANNNARFGIVCDSSNPEIIYNIISHNLGGIGCFNSSRPKLFHNNVWGNSVVGNYYNCEPGIGSISKDPLFLDISKRDYRLSPKSPCLRKDRNIGFDWLQDTFQEQNDENQFSKEVMSGKNQCESQR